MGMLGEQQPKIQSMRPATPGEALLLCHPALHDWRCYLMTEKGVEGAVVPELAPSASNALVAKTLLAPFAASLRTATRVLIIPYGELRQIAFHLLPFDGGHLADKREVLYSLDVNEHPDSQQLVFPVLDPMSSAERHALVIIDSQGSLPHSRQVAPSIIASLTQVGWQVESAVSGVRGPATWGVTAVGAVPAVAINRPWVLGMLQATRFFHFTGHALFSRAGRHELLVAEGDGLLIADILLLAHTPEAVVLFACNSGKSEEEVGGLEGLGLAQTFLLRDSKWVLGTVRNVDEKLAAAVAKAFYARLRQNEKSPFEALRLAVSTVQQELAIPEPDSLAVTTPACDLGAFRIFVR